MGKALTGWNYRKKGNLFLGFLVVGLVLSLIIHGLLWERSQSIRILGFSPESYDTVVPRTFRMKHVEIDPRSFSEPEPTPQLPRKRDPVRIADEHPLSVPSTDSVSTSVLKPPGNETSIPEDHGFSTSSGPLPVLPAPVPAEKPGEMPSLGNKEKQLPALDLPEPSGGTVPGTPKAFSSLDDLLAGETPLTAGTPPILMPTDLLFEYDSDVLRQEATTSLAKLGSLIRKNSSSRFRIEGHTDSFGKEEYNSALSLRRAEAVKAWLVKSMGVNSASVSAVGLGTSHPLAPVTGTIAEQRLNRRVEIVITSN